MSTGAIMSRLRDFHPAALTTGLTAFIFYAFGALPLQIEVAEQLGLSATESSSWIFIVWIVGAVISIALGLFYRLPMPVTWTIPGLVFIGSLSGQFSFAEIVGANLMAGVVIVALGLAGIGKRIMAWLPLPIVMAMFGGSILVYVTRMISATVQDVTIAGVTVVGYLLGRFIDNPRLPPMALAAIGGGIALALTGTTPTAPIAWSLPAVAMPEMDFTIGAFFAISVPMVVLAMGLGNVQGLGFLMAQGYRPPLTVTTVSVGFASILNAMFGGHPATVARTGVAILGGPDAGPAERRYWANIVASALTIAVAFGAATVTSLVEILPRTFVITLAALAILSSLQGALEKAFSDKLRFGALVAFAVAATPFAIFGISSAFWSIVIGVAASFAAERKDLLAYWRRGRDEPEASSDSDARPPQPNPASIASAPANP
ncbi:MAG: benzoate/H(+) symporter BenE family transporter [Alphaproteobacteria bacterium]|nr:benzoate/H(+) symporter BenE family transporter [Alphaproteobacteria bacterium]